MGDGILGQHGDIVGGDQLWNTVIDFRVDMIRASCQHNAADMVCFHITQDLFSLIPHILAGGGKFLPGSLCGVHHFCDG